MKIKCVINVDLHKAFSSISEYGIDVMFAKQDQQHLLFAPSPPHPISPNAAFMKLQSPRFFTASALDAQLRFRLCFLGTALIADSCAVFKAHPVAPYCRPPFTFQCGKAPDQYMIYAVQSMPPVTATSAHSRFRRSTYPVAFMPSACDYIDQYDEH